jgi:hypothetical protein
MKSNDDISEVEVLTALVEYQRHLSRIDELADQFRARAEAARKFLAEKALIQQQLREGTPRSLMLAELGAERLTERLLQSN